MRALEAIYDEGPTTIDLEARPGNDPDWLFLLLVTTMDGTQVPVDTEEWDVEFVVFVNPRQGLDEAPKYTINDHTIQPFGFGLVMVEANHEHLAREEVTYQLDVVGRNSRRKTFATGVIRRQQ